VKGKNMKLKEKELNKTDLINLYINKSNQEVCKILNISHNTLLRMLKKANIKLKGKGNKNPVGNHKSKYQIK
jgi:intein-encoded DNA endonuclease-like protein